MGVVPVQGLGAMMASGRPARRVVSAVLVLLLMVVFVGPILWFMLLAIRPPDTIFARPPVLFFTPSWTAIHKAFVDPGVNAPQLLNSLSVAGGAVLLNLPLSIPAAYALSRFRMRGKRQIMLWYLSLLMAPPVAFLIPYFILMTWLGLSGTYLSMILSLQTITVPFSVWLLKSFFDEVPTELEEAGRIDGARRHVILWRIVLPLVRAGLVVTSMFAFVFAWNNAAIPLVLSARSTTTLPIGTLGYYGTAGVTWTYIGAAATAAMLPPMIIFLLLERHVVRGLTFGSVKG
jgi:multiple sugar transport system permease protein